MYGRNPLLPIQSEMESKNPIPSFTDEDMQQHLFAHVESLKNLKDDLFPKVSVNIAHAQEKQKEQYQRKKGMISCPFKDRDLVLRRNMLQKTKMGHKMEDNWLGPYEVFDIDKTKGTCKLLSKKTGKELKRRVPYKQLKPYIQSEPEACNKNSTDINVSNTDPNNSTNTHENKENMSNSKNKNATDSNVSNTDPNNAPTNTHENEEEMSNSCDNGDNLVQETESLISTTITDKDDQDDQDLHHGTDLELNISSLNEEDLERIMFNIEDELRDIDTGKVNNWRKELLKNGSCHKFPHLKKIDLGFNVHLGPFSADKQLDVILRNLRETFPKAGIDTITKVLLPEACILIARNMLGVSYEDAEKFVDNPRFKSVSLKRSGAKDNNEVKHKKAKIKNDTTDDLEITFTSNGTLSQNEMRRFERPHYLIEKEDKDTVLQSNMLTDRHIMMAQSLLKTQFPEFDGLLSPTLGAAGQFPPMANEFIQIINTMKMHWVCLSTVGCDNPHTINYYCSLNNTSLTKETKKQIASLLHLDKSTRKITIDVKPVHRQSGVDCGVHAIAIALALCLKVDPSSLKFDRREIRKHLWNCFENNRLEMFPHQVRPCNGKETTILLPVYCNCRMPHFTTDEKMAACEKCKEWFHQSCEKIPNKVFKNKALRWKCSNC